MEERHEKCQSQKDRKLYVLDIFVASVSLYHEKLDRIDPTSLGVDLKFADMPLFRIFHADFALTKPDRGKEMSREGIFRVVHFDAGKIYAFTAVPGELVENMRSKSLMLDVYRIKDIIICPYEVVKDPLGNSRIPMSGCLCDHVMMGSNDMYHLPRSYQIKNMFGLVDEQYKPNGYITLSLRLTCFGTFTMNSFSTQQQKLLFKNSGSFNEFLCTKVPYDDEDARRTAEAEDRFCLPEKVFEESELDTPPRPVNIAGLVFICRELALRDGRPPEVIHPNYPLKITYDDIVEREFDPDKTRRQGFEEIISEDPELVLGEASFSKQTGCINIRCPGSICSGSK